MIVRQAEIADAEEILDIYRPYVEDTAITFEYTPPSIDEMENKGRIRSAKEWLEIGNQMQEAGVLFLLLTVGEPLLHPEFKEIFIGLKT